MRSPSVRPKSASSARIVGIIALGRSSRRSHSSHQSCARKSIAP
jgi:hypothetical protein